MEHPVKEISGVISTLTRGTPEEQEATLRTYFLPNASFTHPLCRVPSFDKGTIPLAHDVDSLWVILGIYRWYRTLSPQIELTVDSAVFDQRSGLLYVTIRQVFSLWFVPFYRAPVRLVTVLQVKQRKSLDSVDGNEGRESNALAGPGQERAKYYIASQEDLYPMTDLIKILLPGLGSLAWFVFQLWSTLLCVAGSLLFLPLYLMMNRNPQVKAT